jgi:hypothetical protein
MTAPLGIDPELRKWATARQIEYIDAVELHGSASAAARVLGINKGVIPRAIGSLRRRAAMQGYSPDHDMRRPVPDGYRVAGVSTLYDAEGKVRSQWVKSREDRERLDDLLREFVAHLSEDARGLHIPTAAPEHVLSDIMATYLLGDPHFGMKAIAAEAGEDFDLATADRLTRAGIDRLADVTPAAETALLVVIGDNTHADNSSNRTPGSGHALDVDGRHHQAVLASAKAWTYAAKRLLVRHARVKLWFMPGNHDPDTAYALALCLSMYFENEPRIEVDLSPSLYRYMRFGKVLIGAHHGHGAKQADLPLIMAVDSPEDWGASSFRYCYQGHIHHDSVKEIQGVRVESIRSLAAKDAWHAGQGYRSLRDTRSIVHHKDFGEVERHTCSAAMLSA